MTAGTMGEFVEGLGEHWQSVRCQNACHHMQKDSSRHKSHLFLPFIPYFNCSLRLPLFSFNPSENACPNGANEKKPAINPHVHPRHEAATQLKLMLPSSLSSKLEPLARWAIHLDQHVISHELSQAQIRSVFQPASTWRICPQASDEGKSVGLLFAPFSNTAQAV